MRRRYDAGCRMNCPLMLDCAPNCYKTQEMSGKNLLKINVSKEAFILKHSVDKYESQEMCDKALDACLPL